MRKFDTIPSPKSLTNAAKGETIQADEDHRLESANLENHHTDRKSTAMYSIEQVKGILNMICEKENPSCSIPGPACIDHRLSQQISPGTKLTMSVREAAELIGINKTNVYELVRKGQIDTICIGQKIVIPRQAIFDWIAKGVKHGEKTC